MRFSPLLFNLLVGIMMSSCAQVKTVKKPLDKHLSQKEVEQLNKESVDRVSKRLSELSIAAKASGEDKVRFLASDMYLKASAALMEGDYQTANLIFKHLITLVPNDNFIKQKYAISLIRTGSIEKSEKVLASIFKDSNRRDSKVGLVLAGVYSSLGKVDKSRAIYNRLIKIYPKQEEACIFLAKSYALENKTSKAISLLKKCERKNRKKGIYSYYMGKIFVDKKDYQTAKKYFTRSIKAQRDFPRSVMALGLIYEELGQVKSAEKTYKKYLKKEPSDTLILTRLVQLMFTQEKFVEVIQYAERLSDHEPDNLNLKVKLGILYKDISKFNQAIQVFKDLLVFAPENDKILYYLGGIYQELQDYSNSITYFERIAEESGLFQDSSFQIAQMLSLMAKSEHYNEKKEGLLHQRFITFIDLKIKNITAFSVDFTVVKAAYFESLEDNDQAIKSLESVKTNKGFNVEHRFYLASLFEKENEFNKATELIEEVLEIDNKNAHAWNFLGYSLIERGEKMDQAYTFIKKAVGLSPKDGYIRDSLGWYYFKVGNMKMALTQMKKAIKYVPEDVSINRHLAIIYASLQNFKAAKTHIRKALVASQNESERKELNTALKDLEASRVPASFSKTKTD